MILNQGAAGFSPPTLYRAGVGLSAVIGGTGTTPLSLFSQDGTVGVAAAALTPGGPPDLVALNAGSETLGVLAGLWAAGGSRTRSRLPTAGPTSAIRVADFNGRRHPRPGDPRPERPLHLAGQRNGRFRPGAHLRCRARSHRPDDRRRERRQASRPGRRQRVRRRPGASGRRQRRLRAADVDRPERRPRGGLPRRPNAARHSSSPTRPATASSFKTASRRSRPCWPTAPRACSSRARPCWPT